MNADTDADAFRQLMAGVFALYGRDLSEVVLAIWWEAMRPYDLKAVREALGRHAVNPDAGQYLPKPADVVRVVEGGTADAAALAWVKVQRAAAQVGAYASVVFDDQHIQRAIHDMGGWPFICRQTEDELPFVQQRFVALYRAYRGRGSAGHPQRLIGIIEQENAAKGYEFPPPYLIGDQRLALEVMKSGAADQAPLQLSTLLPSPQPSNG